jgi:GWxTD domain-containing protein
MKKYLIACCLTVVLFSTNLFSANVTAYLTYTAFNIPGKGPYIETHLSVIGNSVKFVKNANGKYQGVIDITINFKQNSEIRNAQKYTLNSPETTDTTKGFPNFLDQQRYPLINGNYDMEISIADKNTPQKQPFITTLPVVINFPDDKITMSEVQLLESYTKSINPGTLTKSGYDLVPYVSSFFPENINALKIYSEIYNVKKILGEGQKVLISYFLESYESKVKLNDYSAFSKQAANNVNILLTEFNIEKLPTGNYNLKVEVRDKDNKIQAEQTCLIQRKNKQGALTAADLKAIDINRTFVNKYKSADTLAEFIRCVRPISSLSEIQFSENQFTNKNLELMQRYFYNFWKTRNTLDPESEWLAYFSEVKKVNKEYGTYGLKGFDTDRGRVYLQYGPPNQLNKVDSDPSALPYEIWQYDVLVDKSQIVDKPHNKQSNKKFVFYNPDLVSNKYRLIHSTAIGEIYNGSWQLLINNRNTPSQGIDDQKVPDNFGSHADDNFQNPR